MGSRATSPRPIICEPVTPDRGPIGTDDDHASEGYVSNVRKPAEFAERLRDAAWAKQARNHKRVVLLAYDGRTNRDRCEVSTKEKTEKDGQSRSRHEFDRCFEVRFSQTVDVLKPSNDVASIRPGSERADSDAIEERINEQVQDDSRGLQPSSSSDFRRDASAEPSKASYGKAPHNQGS